jgi:hypothetical protein
MACREKYKQVIDYCVVEASGFCLIPFIMEPCNHCQFLPYETVFSPLKAILLILENTVF